MENDPLEALFAKYLTEGPDYGAEFQKQNQAVDAQQADYEKLLQATSARKRTPMSKAETFFRLSQAFAKPTKTGNFFESLGNASGVMGDIAESERQVQDQNQQLAEAVAAKIAESRLSASRAKLSDLRQLAGEDVRTQRALIGELIKERRNSGKPQSEAGKAAADSGLTPGTPEYVAFVKKYLDDRNARAMAGVEATNRRLDTAESTLSPTEMKMAQDELDRIEGAKRTILLLNTALQHSAKAFTATAADRAQLAAMKQSSMSRDPRVIASEQLEQILTKSALESLRSTFGTNPTEGERAIQLMTQGLGATSRQSRDQQIQNVIDSVMRQLESSTRRVNEIRSGKLRRMVSDNE